MRNLLKTLKLIQNSMFFCNEAGSGYVDEYKAFAWKSKSQDCSCGTWSCLGLEGIQFQSWQAAFDVLPPLTSLQMQKASARSRSAVKLSMFIGFNLSIQHSTRRSLTSRMAKLISLQGLGP